VLEREGDWVSFARGTQDALFMKHRLPWGDDLSSRERRSTTNVRGLVGGGVTYVSRQTSATCGTSTARQSVSRHDSM
jgi:hypothetical protein